jgi:hypothetical protein
MNAIDEELSGVRRKLPGRCAPINAASTLLLGEFLIGVGYILAGYLLFRVFEFEARRRESLETYRESSIDSVLI